MKWSRKFEATAPATAGYGERGAQLRRSPLTFGLFATVGGLIAIAAFAGIARSGLVITMLVGALFAAVGLDRPVDAMVRRGMRRGVAISLLALSGLVVMCAILAVAVPAMAAQWTAFFDDLPARIDAALDRLSVTDRAELTRRLNQAITPETVSKLATGLLGGIASLVGFVFTLGTTAILTLFMLSGLDRLRAGAIRLVVGSRRERVRLLAEAVEDKVGGYIVGALTIAAFAGVFAFGWCVIAGVPYPLLMALVVAGFDLVPQIGATAGSIIVIATALSASTALAVATLIFFCCYQGLENWVIYPRLMGRAVQISNLAAIVSAMVGWAMVGVLGVLIAVPAYASLQLLVREVVFPRQDAR